MFFAAESMQDVGYIFSNCLVGIVNPIEYLHSGFADIGLDMTMFISISVAILVMGVYDYISLNKDGGIWISDKSKTFRWILFFIIGLIIIFISRKGVATEFIYFQF